MLRYIFFILFISINEKIISQNFAAIVSQEIGKEYIINEKEDTLFVPAQGVNLYSIYDGIVRYKKDGKFSYMDCYGKELFPGKYERAENFFENRARVRINGDWGYINKTGQLVVSDIYKNAYDFCEGKALVKKDDKFGFIDTTGKPITAFEFSDALSFSSGRAWVKVNGKWGAIDHSGKMIIPPTYSHVQKFSNGSALVRNAEMIIAYIDTLNHFLIPFDERNKQNYYSVLLNEQYSGNGRFFPHEENKHFYYTNEANINYSYMCDNLIKYDNEKIGFINKQKIKVIQPQYKFATNFYNGYAIVMEGNFPGASPKFNVIDTKGELQIKDNFSLIVSVYNDIAICKTQVIRYQYYDLKGRFIFKNKYIRADAFSKIK